MSDIATQFEIHAREYEIEQRKKDVEKYKRYAHVADCKAKEYTAQHAGQDKPDDYTRWVRWHKERVLAATAVLNSHKEELSKRRRDFGLWKRMLKLTQ